MRISGIAGRLVAALLVIAAGCGGEDSKNSAGTTTSATEATTTTTPTTTATTAVPTTTAPVAATTTTTKPKPATTTTTAPAKLSPTHFLVARGGCKNEIDYVRVVADRKVVQLKAVVKAASNRQLIAYGQQDDRLLFGAFDCDAKTTSISEIALTDPKATPRLIASDLDVIDADYDIKSKAVLVLTGAADPEQKVVSIDSAGTRTVRWTQPASWRTSDNPLGAMTFPKRLRALTGGEMMIGAYGNNKFLVARVSEGGFMSGGVTGDGELGTFDISILQGAIALSVKGSPDLWLCAFSPVYGSGQTNPTPITSVPGCASNPLPQSLTSLPAALAWAFAGQDGHNLLLAIKNQPYLLDVESLDLRGGSGPPKVYGSQTSDVPYSVYAVAVYELNQDLSKTVPSVTV